LEQRLGFALANRIIPLKEGAQAFATTYRRLPEVAKKNPKLLFLGTADAGYFAKVFGGDISAESFANAFSLYKKVDEFVESFKSLKRRRSRMVDWQVEYESLLGPDLVTAADPNTLDQVIPQSVVFLTGLLFQQYAVRENVPAATLTDRIAVNGPSIATKALKAMLDFAAANPAQASKS
jgi:hypothetical protein